MIPRVRASSRGPYDLMAAGGHAGIVDEALVQKPESDWVAVSNPQAITDARVAPRATAMTDEYLLCMVDRPPSEKAHFLANPCNGMTPPHEIFVSDFFQLRSGAPTSLVASSEGADVITRLAAQGICSYSALMKFETLGDVWQAGGRAQRMAGTEGLLPAPATAAPTLSKGIGSADQTIR